MRKLSERLRWMLADFENLGINEMTANLPAIRDALALAERMEEAPVVSFSGAVEAYHGPHSVTRELGFMHLSGDLNPYAGKTYMLVPEARNGSR